MTEKPGHFEKGVWIEDVPPAPQADTDAMEKRLSQAAKDVISSIDNVIVVTRDMVTTEEGKRYLEKSLNETRTQLQRSLDEVIGRSKAELERAGAELDKKAAELNKKIKG